MEYRPVAAPATAGSVIEIRHAREHNLENVRNGVGSGGWTRIDGFSESVIDWIIVQESQT